MKNFKYLLILLLILTVVAGCKKYPDDDVLIQWHKPEKRIVGTYYIKSFTVNEIDSTAIADSMLFGGGIAFSTPGEHLLYAMRVSSGPLTVAEGNYEFTDKKKKLRIGMALYSGRNVEAFLSQDKIYWDIEELTKNTLKLKTVYNDLENKLWLEKI